MADPGNRRTLRTLALDRRGVREQRLACRTAPSVDDRLALFDRKSELARALRPGSVEDAARLIGLTFALLWRDAAGAHLPGFCAEDFARFAAYPHAAIGGACLRLAIVGAASPPSAAELLGMIRREAEAAQWELAMVDRELSTALSREPAEGPA